MAKGKRQEQRDKRAAAAKQKQHGNQPSPVVPAIPAQQAQPPTEAQATSAASNQQAGSQGVGEGPVSPKRPSVDWQFTIAATEAIVSVCLLILAVVGALYAKGQLNAMREQNAVMIEQNKIMLGQQRPWISTDAIAFDQMKPGLPFPLRFEQKNSGPTPGRVIEEGADLLYLDENDPLPGVEFTVSNGMRQITFSDDRIRDLLSVGKEVNPDFVVPPGDSLVYGMSGLRPLSAGMIEAVKADKLVVISLSFLVYVDATGASDTRHTTWSCSVYNPGSNTFAKTNRHNTMD